ncbi:hypothetical protein FACS189492_3150 [Clostridia bacterium]|nr:hypothetical protein FACS189492_3150 [Clostridia bacterium]
MRVWEKVKENGFDGSYSVVKHFVRAKKEQLNTQATVRFETMPVPSSYPTFQAYFSF